MTTISDRGDNASGDTAASADDYARQQDAQKAALLGGRPHEPPAPTAPAGSNSPPGKCSGKGWQKKRVGGNRAGSTGKPASAHRQGIAVHIDTKDVDAIRDESGASGPLLGYWLALNKLAFQKGNGYRATFAILRIESRLSDRQISACNKLLEKLNMLVVEKAGKRLPNVYRLTRGCYVNHIRELPPQPAAAGELPPPPAETLPPFTMTPPEGA